MRPEARRGGVGQRGPDERLDDRRLPLDEGRDDGGVEHLDVVEAQDSALVVVAGHRGALWSASKVVSASENTCAGDSVDHRFRFTGPTEEIDVDRDGPVRWPQG